MESDRRIVTETGLNARIASIVEPVIEDLGFRLVRVRTSGLNGMTVQIMAEKKDGMIAVEDCEEISKNISPVLDVEDPVKQAYHLEVSSPGIDRPLVRVDDFDRWSGHLAKLELTVPNNGRRRYKGVVLGTRSAEDGAMIGIELPDAPEGEETKVWLPLDTVAEAKLIMTDELMEEAARRAKPS
ncbi:MAG: ribosome maturation factor RimP [Pseudomonadota bacterium]